MIKTILVTGATGFIGQQLVPYLQNKGHRVIAPTRDEIGDIGPNTDWTSQLKGIDTVIHLAGRAHVMREDATDPLSLYRTVNSLGTATLAEQAQKRGVKRFIFASSVKVMGESSEHPLSAALDTPAPSDPYGQSKLEGEDALKQIAKDMQIVILRLPLVYGPGVKGNFINLLKLLQKNIPLPFGAIHNKRSMIYAANLISAIDASLTVKAGIYFPSDQDDLSTPDLIRILTSALNFSPKLLPIPPIILRLIGLLTGKGAMIQRLTGSLRVDGKVGDWVPPYSAKEGLISIANWFKTNGLNR